MKLIVFVLMFVPFGAFSQLVVKENLTKKATMYYDFDRIHPESTGSYYKDFLGETTFKHGKWVYFDKAGLIIEERNYYKGQLHGAVKAYYSSGKSRQEGYFKLDEQDSIYREWYENGNISLEGSYFRNKPSGTWTYYYQNGKQKLLEEVVDTINYVLHYRCCERMVQL
jgi:antitoxin component YwqK of YwqJK toxin-antitoxin module